MKMTKKEFYLLSFTWGLPMTLIGCFISLFMLLVGCKPKKFHDFIYFEYGQNWGGFNAGCFFFVSKGASAETLRHEAGHGLQNIVYGWATPFLVSIPSAIRYWYRIYLVEKKGVPKSSLPDYYSIWFEKQATEWGNENFQ